MCVQGGLYSSCYTRAERSGCRAGHLGPWEEGERGRCRPGPSAALPPPTHTHMPTDRLTDDPRSFAPPHLATPRCGVTRSDLERQVWAREAVVLAPASHTLQCSWPLGLPPSPPTSPAGQPARAPSMTPPDCPSWPSVPPPLCLQFLPHEMGVIAAPTQSIIIKETVISIM